MTDLSKEPSTVAEGDHAALEFAVAVFAHNEEDGIDRCLESVLAAAAPAGRIAIQVLNNGSRDGTAGRVRAWQARDPRVSLIEIEIGDKANAWNVFVHETCPQANWYAFVDGDVTLDAHALAALREALAAHPQALLATGVPSTGRHQQQLIDYLNQYGGVLGNLYATRADFIQGIRRKAIRMPTGFIREDGLVGAFACYGLDSIANRWDKSRVAIAESAAFIFPSLSFHRPDDWRLYWRRRIRYSIGHFQFMMLRKGIKSAGFQHMPAHVAALYANEDLPPLKWRGLGTVFDWIARRQIRAQSRTGQQI